MKRKSVSKAPRRRPARRWKPYGGLVFGPVHGPHGSAAAVFLMGNGRRFSVMWGS